MTSTEIATQILRYCAGKSQVTVEELNEAIPHAGLIPITEVAFELAEARLIRANVSRDCLLEGDVVIVNPINGLTFLGEQYLDTLSPPRSASTLIH